MEKELYNAYIRVLQKELVPAMGCTEPIAVAYAAAVEAGILGIKMFRQGSQLVGGDGIVSKGVENTIDNVSRLASQGMRKTDAEIIKIMLS